MNKFPVDAAAWIVHDLFDFKFVFVKEKVKQKGSKKVSTLSTYKQ